MCGWPYSRTQEGSGAFRCQGSIVRALLAERWVRPGIGFAFRAGSEGWEKVLKIDGAFAPRVVVGTLTGASINAAYGSENLYNRAGARWKCTPIPAVRDLLLSADRCRGSGSPSRRLRYRPDGRCVYMPPKAAIKWRRQAPYLANAVMLYNYPGRSPQPVRKALADSGQNPGGPGP